MKLPNVLFHGTTRARWELGIKQNGLRGDLPRHLVVDYNHYGYVFLTSSKEEAILYAIQTYFFDEQVPSYNKINSVCMEGVIVGVKTSHIRKQIEIDPEHEMSDFFNKALGIEDMLKKIGWYGDWYRYKGNIPQSQIFSNGIVPINHPQNEWVIKIFREGTIETFKQKEVALS